MSADEMITRRNRNAIIGESEELFSATFEQAAVGIAHVAPDGRFLRVNRKLCHITGYSTDELMSLTFQDITHPDDLDADLAQVRQVLSGKVETYSIEKRYIRKDRSLVWINLTVSLVRMPSGEPKYFISVIEDISDRKKAEAALLEKERLLSESQRIAHIGSWTYDMTGRISWSDETYRIYGVSPDTFTPNTESFIKLIHPDDRPAMQVWIRACMTGEKPGELEFRSILPDGTVRFISGRGELQYDVEHKPVYMAGTAQDVTVRKRAEEERQLFVSLANNSKEFIGIADLTFTPFYANAAALHLVGLPDLEAVRKIKVQDVFFPEDQQFITNEFLPRVLRDGNGEIEIRFRHFKTGEAVWMLYNVFAIHDSHGKRGGWATVSRNITDRKRAEQELEKHRGRLEELVTERTAELQDSRKALMNMVEDLREKTDELARANEKLKEVDHLKSLFIASMSHELRTPLNSIIGFTGILLQGLPGPLNQEQRTQLGMVKSSSLHLLSLITDIIDLSKIEAGKIDLSSDRFDLAKVVREVAESFRISANNKSLALNVDAPSELMITSDPRRVRQVLVNLVGNAVKFTDDGGVNVTVMNNIDRVEVSVRDTGQGIKEEDLPKLFRSFSQVTGADLLKHEGSGLGLYLSKKLVTLLGGEIRAESEFGKGSVFSFTLPMWQGARR